MRSPYKRVAALVASTFALLVTMSSSTNTINSAAITTTNAREYDVVVVGGGVSGLRVAQLVQQQGKSVAVLEARDRLGGRLFSVPTSRPQSQQRLDLGATWFWPRSEPLIAQFISQVSMVKKVSAQESDSATSTLTPFNQHWTGDMLYMDRDRPQRMPNQMDQPGTGRIAEGMASVSDWVGEECTAAGVVLDTGVVVDTVTKTDSGFSVTAKGKPTTRARKAVVVALPPALAHQDIQFNPPLPVKLTSTASKTPVWMGTIVKVVVEFSSPFWRKAGLAGSAYDRTGPMQEIHDMSGPEEDSVGAIFGFCSPGADDIVTDATVRKQVEAMFGQVEGYHAPVSVHIQDWRLEEFTSPKNVHELTNQRGTFGNAIYTENHGGILFTSTETSESAAGHIEGALHAAQRTADLILEL